MNVVAWKEVVGLIVTAVALVVVSKVLEPYLSLAKVKAKRAWLDFEKDQPKLAVYLSMFAQSAVVAAEQAHLGDDAIDKKNYALAVMKAWLKEAGYESVDIALIDAAIEEAVLRVFNPDRLGWFSDIPAPDVK